MLLRPERIRIVALSICLASLFLHGSSSSQGARGDITLYDPRIADLVTSTNFPEWSAVVLIDQRIHTWSFEETMIEHAFAVKILTREGIELFGDFISDVYHKKYHDFSVEATIMSPRGERTIVESDNIMKLEFGENEYQYRAAWPGLEIGTIIEIKERIRTEYPITAGQWNFSRGVPTLRSELIFRVPRGALVSFNFTPKDSKLSPVCEIEHKYEKHTITKEVVPPYIDEPYMPPRYIGNPTVYYNIWQATMENYLRFHKIEYDDRLLEWMDEHEIPWALPLMTRNWREIGRAFMNYFDPDTWERDEKANEYRSALSSMIEEIPDKDTSNMVLSLDGILTEFHRRFQPIEHQFFYRNPEESLDHLEGDPFESAYILKRILEERNLRPSIILASDAARGLLDQRNPDPFILRRPLLLISGNGEQYWIDPFVPGHGVNQIPWKYQGVKALWLKEGEKISFITTPLDAAPTNCISRLEEIAIDSSGRLSGKSRISLTGQYLLDVRLENTANDADANRKYLSSLIERLFPDKARVDDVTVESDTRDTMIVSCRYFIDKFGERSGDFMNLDFSAWCTHDVQSAFESDSRKYEIMFPFPETMSLTLKISVPTDYTSVQMPHNAQHEDEWFSYYRTCNHDKSTIAFERTFAITSPKVAAEDYQVARQAIEKIGKFDKESIVLKRSS